MQKRISIIGHRGARGLLPENTIISFIEAIKYGADAIELDVVISKDRQVVVSHEPWMNEEFCVKPDGKPVEANSRDQYNLFAMDYAEIKQFDCGKNGNASFPLQRKLSTFKPLLSDVFRKIESFTGANGLKPVRYIIEIKSEEELDNIFQPDPVLFVKLVMDVVKQYAVEERCVLQSFDVRILQELRAKHPEITLAFLVENNLPFKTNLVKLGFVPPIYSPEFILINEELIHELKLYDIKLVPWTVNEIKDMKRVIEFGVDGIITDYPDRTYKLLLQHFT